MSINPDKYLQSPIYKDIEFNGDPIVVTVSNLKEHPLHFHTHLEIVYLIKGSAVVKSGGKEFTLMEGEFIFINAYEIHGILSNSSDTVVVCIHFFLESGANMPIIIYDIDNFKKDIHAYRRVKEIILTILSHSLEPEINYIKHSDYYSKVINYFYSDLRHAKYKIRGEKNDFDDNEVNLERLANVLDYMYFNYDENLTLDKMSKELHLSKYHLAHILKKGYNCSFQDLLNIVRADRSEFFLLETNLTISQIATKIGASSQNYYSKYFKFFYGLTPLQYRKKYRKETIQHKAFNEEIYDISQIRELITGEKTKARSDKPGLFIDFKSSDAEILLITDQNGVMNSCNVNLDKGDSESLDFEGNEMILVIKRKSKINS